MSGGAVGDEGDGGRRTGDDHDGNDKECQATPVLPLSCLLDKRFGTETLYLWKVCGRLSGFVDDLHGPAR